MLKNRNEESNLVIFIIQVCYCVSAFLIGNKCVLLVFYLFFLMIYLCASVHFSVPLSCSLAYALTCLEGSVHMFGSACAGKWKKKFSSYVSS